MKKSTVILGVVVLMIFVLSVFPAEEEARMVSSACRAVEEVKTVSVYKMNDFNDRDEESEMLLTKPEDVSVFATAVDKAKRQPGIVNIAAPAFSFEMDGRTFYLWIGEEYGTIMNTEDTHTIYSLPMQNAEDVYEVINRYYDFGESELK